LASRQGVIASQCHIRQPALWRTLQAGGFAKRSSSSAVVVRRALALKATAAAEQVTNPMTLELIKAAALLLALSLLQGLLVRFWRRNAVVRQVLSGSLFGGICVLGMMSPIEVSPGVIFDPRSVILSMSGLFGGPVVAFVAACIAGGYRLWLGGGGVYVGVAVVVACSALGLIYRYVHLKGWVKVGVPQLLAFGLIVHLFEVLLFTQLPNSAVEKVMRTVALPLLATFTPATALLGLLLQDIEKRIRTESDLAQSEARLSLHLQNTPLAAISWDRDCRCVQWNKAAERIFGYTFAEAVGRHAVGLVVSDRSKHDIGDVFHMLLTGTGGERKTNENITKDGRTIVCKWYNTPITNEKGEAVGVVSLAEDVTEQKRAEEEIKLKNTLLTTQQEASIDGILSVDTAGRLISHNQRFVEMWELPPDAVDVNSEESLLTSLANKLLDPAPFMGSPRCRDENPQRRSFDEIALKDGRIFERHSAPMTASDGRYYGRLWMFRDITARKRAEALIWNQANFDALTGLANRQMLRDRLEQEIRNSHRHGHRIALLYLDLDQFKDVNDTLGHDMGDKLLVEAAQRLVACVRDVDTVARLGGDEFTIILGGVERSANAERVAEEILKKFSDPFQLGDDATYISTSIGITFFPEDATGVDQMLKNADQAMYAAKARGRNCYQYFTPSMQRAAVARMLMIKDLRTALPASQFRLCYQPIVEMATGAIYKAEALLRWQHPLRGLVGPGEFIPVAEETRMIIAIGDWVFQEAARQSARWRATHHPAFQITVNTSPAQYRDERFSVADWLKHLRLLGLSGEAIVMEITEGLLMDTTAKATEKLLLFRDAGIQVALDDFGTGYSSLSYLKRLDIDYLKIDQSFVQTLAADSDDMALCEAIIAMAHKLGLRVIAEGIETPQQRDLLAAAGCDFGQGYYYSKPLPASQFEKLLAAA
jgi:diguanylate cyclase (GGDEF)-like protein/PAS domain S-box-containing protein